MTSAVANRPSFHIDWPSGPSGTSHWKRKVTAGELWYVVTYVQHRGVLSSRRLDTWRVPEHRVVPVRSTPSTPVFILSPWRSIEFLMTKPLNLSCRKHKAPSYDQPCSGKNSKTITLILHMKRYSFFSPEKVHPIKKWLFALIFFPSDPPSMKYQ